MGEYQGKHAAKVILAVDCMIEEYVDDYMLNIFKDYEDHLKVNTKDEETAREVLKTIATIKVYEKLNSIEIKPEDISDGVTRRLRYLAHSQRIKKYFDGKIKGFSNKYSEHRLKSKNDRPSDPKLFAKSCNEKMAERLSIQTFFGGDNIINETVYALREVLDSNGSISDSFDIESERFVELQKQADDQKALFNETTEQKGIDYLKSLSKEKIDYWHNKWKEKRRSPIATLKTREDDSNIIWLYPKPVINMREWQEKTAREGPPKNNNDAFGIETPSTSTPTKSKEEIERDYYRFEKDSLELENKALYFINISKCKGISNAKKNEKALVASLSKIILNANCLKEGISPEKLHETMFECLKEIKVEQGYNHLLHDQCFQLIDEAAIETKKKSKDRGRDGIIVGEHYIDRNAGFLDTTKNAVVYTIMTIAGGAIIIEALNNNVTNFIETLPIALTTTAAVASFYMVDFLKKIKKTSLNTHFQGLTDKEQKQLKQMIDEQLIEHKELQKQLGVERKSEKEP